MPGFRFSAPASSASPALTGAAAASPLPASPLPSPSDSPVSPPFSSSPSASFSMASASTFAWFSNSSSPLASPAATSSWASLEGTSSSSSSSSPNGGGPDLRRWRSRHSSWPGYPGGTYESSDSSDSSSAASSPTAPPSAAASVGSCGAGLADGPGKTLSWPKRLAVRCSTLGGKSPTLKPPLASISAVATPSGDAITGPSSAALIFPLRSPLRLAPSSSSGKGTPSAATAALQSSSFTQATAPLALAARAASMIS
mmetsp:Transcript_14176/g.42408  ORF Transcript_14176/g.42408 Transcript_14176/m.42408 type:complete len:256 (-) Transcript_14176:403-1170(-)